MSSKFGDYRAKDGEPTSVDFYNKRFRSIDGRITTLEDRVPAEQAVIDDLRRNGLQRIEQAIGPNLERIQKAAELGFLQCHVAENFELTFALGPAVIPLLPGAQRDIYVPTAFVAIVRTSTPHDYATGRTVSWNKQTGVLEVEIVAHFGDPGPHSDLQVEALAGGALAVSNAIAGAAQDRAAAQVARTGAETARDVAVSSSTAAQAAQSAAEAARAGAQTARDQAQAAASGGVKIRASDTTANFLDGKLLVSGALTKAVGSPNGNETLTITARAASTTQSGVARLATPDEAQAGTLGDVAVTPAGLAAAIAATAGGGSSVVRDARSSNQALTGTDRGKLIAFQAGFTQTFVACATLGSGWYAWLHNTGAGDVVLDPNASEQIDGLTSFTMYPGEARLVQCDGTALRSIVLQPFTKLFTTSGTSNRPPGYTAFDVEVLGGGGGGGSGGAGGSSAPDALAGGGGAGGAYFSRRVSAAEVGTSASVA